ncbi:putative nuclease HARBI1 [Cucumis melo var. makuwa]|uniref:Putative nuclease HARBI1 n=1 Tax=Cucumis melo var. makuwa TaxID=1194695 RepID=A0A5D3C0L1_CUCMM|nr:putative nuclease HARBI1 [Cucumis melo var. makuwa]
MDRRCFTIMCHLLRTITGLTSTKVIDVEEMVAMFLDILAHDVLLVIISYVELPRCIRWNVHNVPVSDQARYRTCKGEIAINVLSVCDTKGGFVYVLVGWKGSAVDSRILCDAISRPNGLKVAKGYYYLVDVGYPNVEGFLTPYRG